MRIEKDDNLPSGYRILSSSNNWDVEEDKLCICVSNFEVIPRSENDMIITAYGDGPQQIAEDIMELSREPVREELDTLKEDRHKDFDSIKVHLQTSQHKINKYERDNHYSEIFVDCQSGQSLTFKDAKVSVSGNGDVTVSGQSIENLIDRLDVLIDTEARFTEWQDIVLKRVESNPDVFNERIKEN